jgi:tetratricopeptide (TPR) repeat protein
MAETGNTIDKLCQRAKQAIEQRDWNRARQAYQQALTIDANLPDVHYGLATVFFQLRDLATAAQHFKEVTRIEPKRASAYINLGAVCNLLQRYDEAVAALRRGIQLDPTRVEGYYNLGLVYRRMGQPDMAIQAYREALRLNPRMPDAHLNLANIYLEKGQFRPAALHYEHALELRPNWEKAGDGLAQAREAIAAEAAAAAATPAAPDPNAHVDPERHRNYLVSLHQATVDSDVDVVRCHQVLEKELEPSIKELSSALLYRHHPSSELDECVDKCEAAIENLRTAHRQLQGHLAKLRNLEEQFPA